MGRYSPPPGHRMMITTKRKQMPPISVIQDSLSRRLGIEIPYRNHGQSYLLHGVVMEVFNYRDGRIVHIRKSRQGSFDDIRNRHCLVWLPDRGPCGILIPRFRLLGKTREDIRRMSHPVKHHQR